MDQLRLGNRGPHALIYGGTAPESQDLLLSMSARARAPECRALFL